MHPETRPALASLLGLSLLLAPAAASAANPTSSALFIYQDTAINEASGLAYSVQNPGIVWTHNDSGDTARGFAVDFHTGQTRLELRLTGVTAADWEDCAIYQRPGGGADLFFADIGDNALGRSTLQIHRVTEPTVPTSGRTVVNVAPSQTYTVKYPDGPHDCESLLVHPITGRIYLVTKSGDGITKVFRVPATGTGTLTLEYVATITPYFTGPTVWDRCLTSGDISPDGRHVILVCEHLMFEFDAPADPAQFDQVWTSARREWAVPHTRQWEDVCYEPGSDTILLGAEGVNTPVMRIRFRGSSANDGNGTYKTITVDGSFADWAGVPAIAESSITASPSTARDITNIYVANDANNVYVRVSSANSLAFSSHDFLFLDGEGNTTGFGFFSHPGIKAIVTGAGASAYGLYSNHYTDGPASPSSVPYGPTGGAPTSDLEFSIPRNMKIPSTQGGPANRDVFPNSSFSIGAGNDLSSPYDAPLASYTFATAPSCVRDWGLY